MPFFTYFELQYHWNHHSTGGVDGYVSMETDLDLDAYELSPVSS